jgi:hypothetical protein
MNGNEVYFTNQEEIVNKTLYFIRISEYLMVMEIGNNSTEIMVHKMFF